MKNRRYRLHLAGVLLALPMSSWPANETVRAASGEPISPIPVAAPAANPSKVELGRILFNDARLSRGNAVTCAKCHNVAAGGADGLEKSIGIGGRRTLRNAPSIFNVSLWFRQGWDGRTESVEQQTDAVIHDAGVMATNWDEVRGKLRLDPAMTDRFKEIYADGLQNKNIADALVTYQRSLTTPNSRFDKYLRGDQAALSPDEIRGYQTFKSNGCVACHQGVGVGGNMFQAFGVMGERGAYVKDRNQGTAVDQGRFNRTSEDADRFLFRVPSLRNVAITAPYLHDGSAPTLNHAVRVMFKYQLARTPSSEDVEVIVKFLHTLTGELDGKPLDPAAAR